MSITTYKCHPSIPRWQVYIGGNCFRSIGSMPNLTKMSFILLTSICMGRLGMKNQEENCRNKPASHALNNMKTQVLSQ